MFICTVSSTQQDFWGTSQADSISDEQEITRDQVVLKKRKQDSPHLLPRHAVTDLYTMALLQGQPNKTESEALMCNLHSGQRWRPGPCEKLELSA